MRGIWAGALLTCYLAIGMLMLLIGGRASGSQLGAHAALLVVMATATFAPGVPTWIRNWMPLAALLFLYSEMPWLIAAVGHDTLQDASVVRWEAALFAGQPARAWAAGAPSQWLSELLHGAYLSYYGIIFVVPAWLQSQRRDTDVARAVFILMATFIACFAAYLVVPVAGPRYLWPAVATSTDGRLRELTLWLLDARSSRGTAFPSSHVAVAVAQSVLAVTYFGRRAWFVAALTLLLAVGAVLGGFHYAVDVVAGALLGAAIGWAGRRWIRRAQPKASAPT
jgi:membrane-associated phospholipid phosphatase